MSKAIPGIHKLRAKTLLAVPHRPSPVATDAELAKLLGVSKGPVYNLLLQAPQVLRRRVRPAIRRGRIEGNRNGLQRPAWLFSAADRWGNPY